MKARAWYTCLLLTSLVTAESPPPSVLSNLPLKDFPCLLIAGYEESDALQLKAAETISQTATSFFLESNGSSSEDCLIVLSEEAYKGWTTFDGPSRIVVPTENDDFAGMVGGKDIRADSA